MERDSLASRLRDLRLSVGLSQQALGARLHRPQSYISKIENAERRVELHEIEEWAQATGRTLYWTVVPQIQGGASPDARDADIVATVAWLLAHLEPPERALLESTVRYLRERIGGQQR